MNQILNIATLGDTTDDAINPPSGTYTVANIVATADFTTMPAGITYTAPFNALGNTAVGACVSLESFNNFRYEAARAVTTIADKIDEILTVSKLSC